MRARWLLGLVTAATACSDDVVYVTVPGPSGGGGDAGVVVDDAGNVIGPDGAIVPRDGGGAGSDAGANAGQPLPAGASTRTYNAGGRSRSVALFAPSTLTGPAPLVLLLHGNGDTNANFVAALGMQAKATASGFVFAAPQGVSQSFTYLGQPLSGLSWDPYRSVAEGNIDLPLLDAIRADLGASSTVDPKRIFVFGYSQGGYLAFRYGMDASASLSCAAVIAAANPRPGSGLVASAPRKVPVVLQIGTNDSAVSAARSTRTELQNAGFPVQLNEIAGAGHVPFPGDPNVPLGYCLGQALP
jgi:polyhydroxybutyrate depolymerase